MINSAMNQASKYEARAPPRRRMKKDETEDQPIFLRKAYTMITTCPPEIGKFFLCIHESVNVISISVRRLVRERRHCYYQRREGFLR
jgi:hypothetical protein